MTQAIKIHAQALAAASLVADKAGGSRPYLEGVFCEMYADNTCGLVATNGYIFAAYGTKQEGRAVADFFLPAPVIKAMLAKAKLASKKLDCEFEVIPTPTSIVYQVNTSRSVGEVMQVEISEDYQSANFPDWRRMMPAKEWDASYMQGTRVAVSSALLHKLGKVCRALGGEKSGALAFEARGNDPWPVWPYYVDMRHDEKLKMVIMPMRA